MKKIEKKLFYNSNDQRFKIRTKFSDNDVELLNGISTVVEDVKMTDYKLLESILSNSSTAVKLTDNERDYFGNSKYVVSFLKEGNYIEAVTANKQTSFTAVNEKKLSDSVAYNYKSVDFFQNLINVFESLGADIRQKQARELTDENHF